MDQLRSIVALSSFQNLHNRLERWSDSYQLNSCDQNVSQAIEILELNSRLQGQVFNLLAAISIEGGTYGGCDPLKRRLLPWLASGISRNVTQDTSLKLIHEAAAKDARLRQVSDEYEARIRELENEVKGVKVSSDGVKNELETTRNELQVTRKAASGDLGQAEDELNNLRKDLSGAQEEVRRLKNTSLLVDDYETQLRRLRGEVNLLRDEKAILLTGRPAPRPLSPPPAPLPPAQPTSSSSSSATSPSQIARQHGVIDRLHQLYARGRQDALATLRLGSDDEDRNAKIVNQAVIESFRETRLSFRQYRLRVRKALLPHQSVDESLEEAVTSYVDRHGEFHEVYGLKYHEVEEIVADVLRGLNRNPTISYAPHIDYYDLKPFIRKVVEVAWSAQCLHEPLDVQTGIDGDLIKDALYRRSYDSDYSSYVVSVYAWPALVNERGVAVSKGEVVTRKPGQARSRSRSRTPARRSRSISPRRPIRAY